MAAHTSAHRLSAAGMLVALGVIYGDIGTSPLYVMKAIVGTSAISPQLVLGGLSCVFWTLLLLTTIKYVIVTLRADNNGEGGTFSLYSLVRRQGKWLVIPAMIGGASLLADGMITPPISVASAIEGLTILNPDLKTVPIVLAIITGIFVVQQFGTNKVGVAFGPVMSVWFGMLGTLGFMQLIENPSVLAAVNPVYAWDLLTTHPQALWLIGAVFLCTTGAEALYSDMGHCGRPNIRISWIFVKITLLLNYFGQGAWILARPTGHLDGLNPFYGVMPEWFVPIGIAVATLAAIIASQAMITGTFTLIAEAMRLDMWPKFRIRFPSDLKGQIYVPSANWMLYIGCVLVVLYFQKSENMEHAYGLAITLTMVATTILLGAFLRKRGVPLVLVILFVVFYLGLESLFLTANIVKIPDGGFITLIISMFFIWVMWTSYRARAIKSRLTDLVSMEPYLPRFRELSEDTAIPKYSTHLVYMTSSPTPNMIEQKDIYSIFQKRPKRADVYWFIHVDVIDSPYGMEYEVKQMCEGKVIWIHFKLGFRVEQRINVLFRQVVQEMVKRGEVDIRSRYPSLQNNELAGDFRFVVLQRYLSLENALNFWDNLVMQGYFLLKRVTLSEDKAFGLDTSSVTLEKMPMLITPVGPLPLKRIEPEPPQAEPESADTPAT